MEPKLKVVIPSYNSVKWLRATLNSVKKQIYTNYDVCVIDDASTQQGQRELVAEFCAQNGWTAILREQNHGALANIVDGIKKLAPQDEDVILLIDGDDWLFDTKVFSKIAEAYRSKSVYMTYGQFVTYPRWQIGLCKPLSQELLQKKNFREADWSISHLRTFKYKLWKLVKEEDLKDISGNYYRTAWDCAMLFPMLEMTGGHGCKFIEDILYVYNLDNPLNDCVAHTVSQNVTAKHIRNQPAYPQVFQVPKIGYQPHTFARWRNLWITLYKKLITPKVYFLAGRKLLKKAKII